MFHYFITFFPALLDDLDKELNNYVMRAREWYGWHFPELGKIVQDNLAFAKVVKLMGKSSFQLCFYVVLKKVG
jgi:RNA processing factor Prp31